MGDPACPWKHHRVAISPLASGLQLGRSDQRGSFGRLFSEMSSLRRQLETLNSALATHPAPDAADRMLIDRLQIYATVFGTLRIYRGDRPLPLGNQRPVLELCRYLVARLGQPVSRDELLELLWPECDPHQAVSRLHVATSTLRRAVDEPGTLASLVQFRNDSYFIPEDSVLVDVAVFEEHYRDGQRCIALHEYDAAARNFEDALALYLGEYLADDLYAEWTFRRRAHFAERRISALMFLSEHAMVCRRMARVVEYAQQILEADNLSERAHRDLMRAHYYLGQRACAVRQFQNCEATLRDELNVEPSELTVRLYRAIREDVDLPPESRLYP